MATIICPDCKNDVSEIAPACPHCARPQPSKSVHQIERESVELEMHQAKADKQAIKQQEKDNNDSVWGLLWLGHALVVWAKLGFWWGVSSLFFGPLVWLFAR